jgi:hypothetical protein
MSFIPPFQYALSTFFAFQNRKNSGSNGEEKFSENCPFEWTLCAEDSMLKMAVAGARRLEELETHLRSSLHG